MFVVTGKAGKEKPTAMATDSDNVLEALGITEINIEGWLFSLDEGTLVELMSAYDDAIKGGKIESHVGTLVGWVVQYKKLEEFPNIRS